MAKAISLYTGVASNGMAMEVAQRTDGAWFFREYGWNGFAMGWTKWTAISSDKIQFITESENQYTGEKYSIENGEVMEWGFNRLNKCKAEKITYRLPN